MIMADKLKGFLVRRVCTLVQVHKELGKRGWIDRYSLINIFISFYVDSENENSRLPLLGSHNV